MIRFRLRELMADKGFRERRVITMIEVANATGINRMTLSKIANHPGYSTVTDNLDRLCDYFQCSLEHLAEYVPKQAGEGDGSADCDKDFSPKGQK